MFQLAKFRRAISLLVMVSTLMLSYQAFAHAHMEGPVTSNHGQAVMTDVDRPSLSSDIFSFETAQGSCHIFNHLTVSLSKSHVVFGPAGSSLSVLHTASVSGLSLLPPFQPPKL